MLQFMPMSTKTSILQNTLAAPSAYTTIGYIELSTSFKTVVFNGSRMLYDNEIIDIDTYMQTHNYTPGG